MQKVLLALLGCVSLAACGGGSTGSGGGAPVTEPPSALETNDFDIGLQRANDGPEIFEEDSNFAGLINGIRRDEGSGDVTYNARLDAAAQGHADDMVARGYFSHVTPEGLTVEDRIRAQGYDPVAFGENIAGRQQNDSEVLQAWRDSPSHNRLLLADSVDEFGLAVAGTGSETRWVLVMAAD